MTRIKAEKQFWTVLWRSQNQVDGKTESIQWEMGLPLLFTSRTATRAYIKHRWGYIAVRPDLHKEPHGWKMPIPIKVNLRMTPAPTRT